MLLILWMRAPILFNGVMTRPIGREFRDSSPDMAEEKFWPARIPDRSLVVVPLFPTSNVQEGADNPRSPLP